MANHWADHGVAVTLITTGSRETDFYALRPAISRRALALEGLSTTMAQTISMTFRRLRALRREIASSRPDVTISFVDVTNVLTILAASRLGGPVIVSERSHPTHHEIGGLRNLSRKVAYHWADAVVVQSEHIAADAMKGIAPRRLLRVIPNFARASSPGFTCASDATRRGNILVSIGSLTPRKQFDVLLRAFARVAASHQDWQLIVVGEGPERASLEALAERLGIASRVRLPGLTAEPEQFLRQADLFALTSRYEGFPNALLEAMAAGLPVVSFDCPSGPRSIIRNEIDGVLVPDQDLDALALALDRLMSSPEERGAFGRRAREVTERFGLDRVMAMWDDLIAACIRKRSPGSGVKPSPS